MPQQSENNAPDFQLLFESLPGHYLVLLPDPLFTIVAVSKSYAQVTMTKPQEILHRPIFEVFPDNPDDPNANGVVNLTESLKRVIKNKTSNKMNIQKYDIRRPGSEGGGFEERYWCPVNSPVLNAKGEVQYIIHRVEDVTEQVKLKNIEALQFELKKQHEVHSKIMRSEIAQREEALQTANEKLRQSQELSRSLVDGINDCLKVNSIPQIEKQKEKILIVEDNVELCQFLVELLEPHYQTDVVYSGEEALQKALLYKPHLILCELDLPQMNGSEVLKCISQNADLENTLFILLTNDADDVLRLQLFRQGIQDYIVKPFRPDDILVRIQNILTIRKVQDLNYVDGVLENALDCVIGVNCWGKITHWNSQAELTFGWTKDEAIGRIMSETIIPLNFRSRHEKSFLQFLKTGQGQKLNRRLELVGLKKNGDQFPIELSVTPIRTKESFVFYGFIRDITERVRALEQLQLAKEQAESASHAKSTFLANMSHEIRTPLAAILGFSELLSDPSVDDESKINFNKAIKRNGELLLNLINEILDLSKVESGKLSVDKCDCLLYELVSDILSALSLKASEKSIRLLTQYSPSAPKVIHTDPLRLKQILLNIVGNAVKFTSNGSVEISIESQIKSDGHSTLTFTVKDTGIGISHEDKIKLFQPFSQVDTSSTRQFGGTGLGLALSKHFAKLLGGDIILEKSQKGKGSSFIITIDAGLKDQTQQTSYHTPLFNRSAQSPFTSQELRIDGLRILLAEDSTDNQFLISQILKKAGAIVEIADNGKVALEKVQKNQFDILLIDIQMPIMDGYTTVSELRKSGLQAPVIALTANALQGDREKSLISGFNEHISKPINRETLLRIIHNFCHAPIS